MNPIFYKYNDPGAPAYVGDATAGEIVKILDACLVNGYGSKAGAGWTIEYTGTNRRVYRAPAGNRFSVFVDDTPVIAYGFWKGYIAPSGLDLGSGAWGGCYMKRGAQWQVIADDRTVYFMAPGRLHVFGDMFSLMPADAFATVVAGMSNTTGSTTYELTPINGGSIGVARGVSQVGAGIGVNVGGYSSSGLAVGGGGVVSWMNPLWPWPNPADSSLHLGRISVGLAATGLRGYLRGVWLIPHSASNFSTDVQDPTVLEGSGDFAGRIIEVYGGIQNGGVIAFERTAWDHN